MAIAHWENILKDQHAHIHSSQGPLLRLPVKDSQSLCEKLICLPNDQPKGQPSSLYCFGESFGIEASRCHLFVVSLSHPSLPVSPIKELLPFSGPQSFVGATWEIPLDHLTLVANRTYALEFHRTITNWENVLKWLPSPGHSKRQQSKEICLSEKEVY